MANTAGLWHALIVCYGQHRRPLARSHWLLWSTPQAPAYDNAIDTGETPHAAARIAWEAGIFANFILGLMEAVGVLASGTL